MSSSTPVPDLRAASDERRGDQDGGGRGAHQRKSTVPSGAGLKRVTRRAGRRRAPRVTAAATTSTPAITTGAIQVRRLVGGGGGGRFDERRRAHGRRRRAHGRRRRAHGRRRRRGLVGAGTADLVGGGAGAGAAPAAGAAGAVACVRSSPICWSRRSRLRREGRRRRRRQVAPALALGSVVVAELAIDLREVDQELRPRRERVTELELVQRLAPAPARVLVLAGDEVAARQLLLRRRRRRRRRRDDRSSPRRPRT